MDIIIEQLLGQRDYYLNTLKHFSFQMMLDPSEEEMNNIEKLQLDTIEQLKKVEQEIAFLTKIDPNSQ